MNFENLKKWLKRERKMAALLTCFAKRVDTDVPVNTWTKDEIDAQANPEQMVLGACDDWVAQRRESTLFLFQWFDSQGKPLTSCEYRMAPVEDGSEPPLSRNQINADQVSTQQIIAQFMRHDEQREQTLIKALGVIFEASQSTINSQRKLVEELQRQNLALTVQVQQRNETADPEETAELRRTAIAESEARAKAWEKFEQIGPPLLQAVLNRFSNH